MIFHCFCKSPKKNFSFTNTAIIACSKSFGKQSVTSWFAGVREFGTRNLTPAAMLLVAVQRGLLQRGGGEDDGLVAGWRMGSK